VSIVTTLYNVLEATAVLLVGLLLRVGVFVLVAVALATPVLLAVLGVRWALGVRRRLLGLTEVGGLPWRSGLLHTVGHLWMKPERAGLRLGLDGLAPRLLPGVKRIALPVPGATLRRGDSIAEVVTASGRVPIAVPMDGTVTDVNRSLLRDPERLARDPYLGGWLVKLRPKADDLRDYLRDSLARSWFEAESQRLARLLEQEMGVAAADGGQPLVSLEKALRREQWESLTERFLKAA
jgi:glycine cleavage system H lipoate-binding protein